MKLWWLTNNRVESGENAGLVIRARDENTARQIAAQHCRDEGVNTWIETTMSMCTEMEVKGEEQVILVDFNAG